MHSHTDALHDDQSCPPVLLLLVSQVSMIYFVDGGEDHSRHAGYSIEDCDDLGGGGWGDRSRDSISDWD